jgi:hypothetical protein
MPNPTEEQIRARADQLWEEAGRPEDRRDEFRHQAERELRQSGSNEMTEPIPKVLPG